MAKKKADKLPISRELVRWANHEIEVHSKLKEQQKWCESHKHPEARLVRQEDHPRNHLYCNLCNNIFYDPKHPAYKEALKRGKIDSSYDSD